MGIWQGILQGMQMNREARLAEEQMELAREEREFIREKFQTEILERRKNAVFPLLVERLKADTESAKERAQLVRSATGLGFSSTVADALSRSGQLTTLLDVAQRRIENDELDANWISGIEKSVSEAFPDLTEEQLGSALSAGLSANADLTTEEGQQESLLEAYMAAKSITELDALEPKILKELSGQSTYGSLPPFEIDFGGSKAESLTEVRQLDNLIAGEIQPIFQDAFIVQPDGSFTFNPESQDAALVRRLQTKMRRLVREKTQPGQSFDEAISELSDFVYNATQRGLSLGEIIPKVEAQDFTVPEVVVPNAPAPETQEDTIKTIGDFPTEPTGNIFDEFRGR